MKVYLASRFSRQLELREYANELTNLGIKVTSRWLNQIANVNHSLNDVTDWDNRLYATQDAADIDAADVLVLFSENPKVGTPRGGRHWETGYAYGKGKTVIVCGPKENIFHYFVDVAHIPDWNDTKQFLSLMDKVLKTKKENNGF